MLSRQPKNALIFQIYQCMCNLITYKYLLHQSACIHTIKTITLCKIYHFFFKNVIFHYFRAKSVTFDRKNGASSVNTQPISIFFSVLWPELNYLKSEEGITYIWRHVIFYPPYSPHLHKESSREQLDCQWFRHRFAMLVFAIFTI